MKILNMSKKKFDSLELLELPNHVFNTEGKIYILPSKNRWQSEIKLLKKLYLKQVVLNMPMKLLLKKMRFRV